MGAPIFWWHVTICSNFDLQKDLLKILIVQPKRKSGVCVLQNMTKLCAEGKYLLITNKMEYKLILSDIRIPRPNYIIVH
jgi:hypothetical protein